MLLHFFVFQFSLAERRRKKEGKLIAHVCTQIKAQNIFFVLFDKSQKKHAKECVNPHKVHFHNYLHSIFPQKRGTRDAAKHLSLVAMCLCGCDKRNGIYIGTRRRLSHFQSLTIFSLFYFHADYVLDCLFCFFY